MLKALMRDEVGLAIVGFFGTDRRAILTAPGETVEIDQLSDLYVAEGLLRHREATAKLRKAS